MTWLTVLGIECMVAGVALLAYAAFEWLTLRWHEVDAALDETRETYL